MPRKSKSEYPADWPEISCRTKEEAGGKCVRCGHPDDKASGHVLTVHHLDLDPANCAWHNLPALCQRCHLQIQAKVFMERGWLLEHSEWFRPYVAGYYAFCNGLPDDKEYVLSHLDQLIAIGQGVLSNGDSSCLK